MNHCVDCLHWDEDQADEQGYAECQCVEREVLSYTPVLGEVKRLRLLVCGDDTCSMFTPKRTVVSKST